jgi:hypothetical protein
VLTFKEKRMREGRLVKLYMAMPTSRPGGKSPAPKFSMAQVFNGSGRDAATVLSPSAAA